MYNIVTQPRTEPQTERYTKMVNSIQTFIKAHYLEKGYSPTAEEIGQHCGLRSKSAIWRWLELMKENGLLEFDRRIGRSFRLPGQKVTFPGL